MNFLFASSVLSCLALTFIGVSDSANVGCQLVKFAFTTKGLGSSDVPSVPISGVPLSICPSSSSSSGGTCCTKEMESNLMTWSSQQFKLALDKRASQISNTLRAKMAKIEDFVEGLLIDSQSQFDENFRRTYGILYERNAIVFTDYFQELKNFYSNGNIDLLEMTDKFFTTLYQKMFQVMNSQYTFDPVYLTCISKKMEEAKPFGDVPSKVASSVKRSMVAMRTLTRALKSGYAIAENVKKISSSNECLAAVQKMNSCPVCEGLTDLKPCNNYCLNVMKGCLAYHIEIQQQWDQFIDSLLSLTDRLTGPFNVEQIVLQLDISISDAIMNFQDSGFKVTQKAFETCGTPRLMTKRDVASHPDVPLTSFMTSNAPIQTLKRNLKKSELEKLMADLKKSMKPSQKFWSRLPYAMCSNTASTEDNIFFEDSANNFGLALNNEECWNGHENGKYDKPVVEDGLDSQAKNPEVPVSSSDDSSGLPNIVKEQIYQLRSVTNQLKMAHKGQDVEWWDRELERRDKSSTLTFEGSGDADDDVTGYEGREDDEDFAVEGSGAGYGDVDDDDVDVVSGDVEDDNDAEKVSKVNEPWRPWSKEEIEVIETTSTTSRTTTTTTPSRPSSGATSQNVFSPFVYFSILFFTIFSFQNCLFSIDKH